MRLRKTVVAASVLALSLGAALTSITHATAQSVEVSGPDTEFTVIAESGADANAVRAVIEAAGGDITGENSALGIYSVTAPSNGFIEVVSSDATVLGAAHDRRIGTSPKSVDVEKDTESGNATTANAPQAANGEDPLDSQLWGHEAINAFESRKVQDGSKKVSVGVMDTGVDKSHPDLTQNFDTNLSRSFVDGTDPSGGTDPNGHGTHVAGTIAAAQNGVGISGIAPDTNLVDLRVATDDGFFFLKPVADALTYAGDAGIDVVNMSFFVDPWLFNCTNNPADTPEQQHEQQSIIEGINRALDYAHYRGVTLIAALGNEDMNLGAPEDDDISPNFPADNEKTRVIDNSTCFSMPSEGRHAIGVSAIGPTGVKSFYSNWGVEQISVAAPGGDTRALKDWIAANGRDYSGGILSSYPTKALQDNVDTAGNPLPLVNADGTEITEAGLAVGVQKQVAADGTIGYYRPLQGTSMAAPHATAVAALIVSQFGWNDWAHRGTKTMNPWLVEQVLTNTATETACPEGGTQVYGDLDEAFGDTFTATCTGDTSFNDFFGNGMINAMKAVRPWR